MCKTRDEWLIAGVENRWLDYGKAKGALLKWLDEDRCLFPGIHTRDVAESVVDAVVGNEPLSES